MLIKSLEDSGWFIPIEREGLPNLLNERKILRSTRENYQHLTGNKSLTPLPPLLYAGVILEGGIITYETNIVTGGVGVRYFGIGGSGGIRRDQVSVYLRAVAVKTGRVLKTVSTTKTILSKEVDVGIFRFVRHRRLLEVEAGFTTNEPIQMCVMEAIDKAVHDLIIEGILDNIWELENHAEINSPAIRAYCEEKACLTNKAVLGPEGRVLAGKAKEGEGKISQKEPSHPAANGFQKQRAPEPQASREPVPPAAQASQEHLLPVTQAAHESAPPQEVPQMQSSQVPQQGTPTAAPEFSKAVAYQVAPGDGGLRQIVASHYPDDKKFGYCAVILANHQIYNEDQLSPGQNLRLPQVDKNDHVITYKNKHYYIYKLYHNESQAKQATAKLKEQKIRFFVRQTWLPNAGAVYRIFLGGYEQREELNRAIALAEKN